MAKNPFKKKGITDTLVNVGIGGAANVAMDYAVSKIDALSSLDSTTINAIKIGVGVLGGTMTTNKMLRAAVDGIATVGVSNLVAGLMSDTSTKGSSGIPSSTIGRIPPRRVLGNKNFVRRVSGVTTSVMGK